MDLISTDDELDSAYYVIQRFITGLGPDVKTLNTQVADWCLKIRLAWERSADGPENDDAPEQLDQELIDAAEVASILNVTTRQARRLASDLDGRKRGGVWLFPRQAVTEYMEAKWSNSTRRQRS